MIRRWELVRTVEEGVSGGRVGGIKRGRCRGGDIILRGSRRDAGDGYEPKTDLARLVVNGINDGSSRGWDNGVSGDGIERVLEIEKGLIIGRMAVEVEGREAACGRMVGYEAKGEANNGTIGMAARGDAFFLVLRRRCTNKRRTSDEENEEEKKKKRHDDDDDDSGDSISILPHLHK